LPLDTLKFHQLQIVKGTAMAADYRKNPNAYPLFSKEEYIEFFIDFLERLNPGFVVERFTSEVPPRFLAGPGWGLIRTFDLLQMLEKRLEERNTWQGRLYEK
jgi:radical SAM superfamily enzyme